MTGGHDVCEYFKYAAFAALLVLGYLKPEARSLNLVECIFLNDTFANVYVLPDFVGWISLLA